MPELDVTAEKAKQTCWCFTPGTRHLAPVHSQRCSHSELFVAYSSMKPSLATIRVFDQCCLVSSGTRHRS